ncbi:glycoside hydrolase family 55 protein [Jaapia argillacea MUCL 33604]|uniref:Glycoside hydrolase family 55 protein n=1 Tax=Jaapia argillacea MUCL 33604 TaxID=933084 RepID=A0A067Q3B1_9AGAM|nr:glycoside hydrolase family 55 protein [Jaapia argillacea MUCL 33604]
MLRWIFLLSAALSATTMVLGLGTSCTAAVPSGTAAATDPFWMENIKHQGMAAYNPSPSTYPVFRNVKDYGAKGDGVTDDTVAINAALSAGTRCGEGTCQSSTISPAVVFFPQGTYLVSSPIQAWYYTQIIGDARVPPTLLAAANFTGIAVIDADPYVTNGGGAQWYVNQNNFFRSVRNFVIDLRRMPATSSATGLHWQVSQATSLMNIVVEMSTASGTAHQGIFMENGSGGYMGDIVFNGGKYGIWVGNQQFTVRNITVNNANTAIFGSWNWGWTFQGVTINNCTVGFDLTTGGLSQNAQTTGAEAIIDATVTNTPIFVRSSTASNGKLAGSLVLNNIQLSNVPTAVGVVGGAVVLAGGTTTIESWGQGNVYSGTNPNGTFVQSNIPAPNKASVLLDSSGRIFTKTHPQYANYAVSQFVSVKDQGAKGDGTTDDTAALQAVFDEYSGCKIIFFDQGSYVITSTLNVPAGTQMVGEAWTEIIASGSAFASQTNPEVAVRVGEAGSSGLVEITDIIFTTRGPAPGAILVEWNAATVGSGMWDTHISIPQAAGTNLEGPTCDAGVDPSTCYASFLALHLTAASTAYLEGTWIWLADHDLDGTVNPQLSLASGRGILSESAGPVWMVGTAEHHVLYQYGLVGAQNHYMGLIQTETPYFQPAPIPPAPFTSNSAYHDPTYNGTDSAWALWIQSSTDIIVFGAGHYSFYSNYTQACLTTNTCQNQIVNVDSTSTPYIYSLSTVGTSWQLSVNEVGIIAESKNINGFASTVTSWTPT